MEADPSLRVSYPEYDLGSRPAREIVGDRAALSWEHDTFDRRTQVVLPAGVGRKSGNLFEGFSRQFDTLDRLSELDGLGGSVSSETLGARWDWGGRNRMYGMTTKGRLQSAARYGFIRKPEAFAVKEKP